MSFKNVQLLLDNVLPLLSQRTESTRGKTGKLFRVQENLDGNNLLAAVQLLLYKHPEMWLLMRHMSTCTHLQS